jgi:glycosyltransferase involved in cell wall biosynthesis
MAERAVTGGVTVSVIVPVWNVEPYLRACLDSVVGQTIGLDRIELIAVDDGSTDGGGSILDEYAARYPQVTVIHEPNSGGPGRPRNVGLDRATGTYVFSSMPTTTWDGGACAPVAIAERNASDIVLGRWSASRPRVPRDRCVPERCGSGPVELVYPSANVLKLFRRSLIERLVLRFRRLAGGEDGDFMARAYPEASTILVVADYDCYFVRRRRAVKRGGGPA